MEVRWKLGWECLEERREGMGEGGIYTTGQTSEITNTQTSRIKQIKKYQVFTLKMPFIF